MITYVWPPQSVAVAVPPVQFLKNGANQTVVEDTAVPANNNPLPAGLYIIKDGVIVPVLKDTGLPSNTVGIPVEVVAASGTPINITAGDLNVQLSDQGVNFDSLRLGDGSGIYLEVNADGSINVADIAAVKTAIESLDTKTPALVAGKVPVDTGLTQALTDTQLRATAVAVSGPLTDTQLRAAPVPISGTVTATVDTSLLATAANQATQQGLIGALTETAPATDTASSGLNGRLQRIAQRITSLIALLPASLGQKTMAASLAVTLASDQAALPTTQTAKTVTWNEGTVSTVTTVNAPAGAKSVKVYGDKANDADFRIRMGGTAVTTSTGIAVEPGRDMDFDVASDISIIAVTGTQRYSIVWGV